MTPNNDYILKPNKSKVLLATPDSHKVSENLTETKPSEKIEKVYKVRDELLQVRAINFSSQSTNFKKAEWKKRGGKLVSYFPPKKEKNHSLTLNYKFQLRKTQKLYTWVRVKAQVPFTLKVNNQSTKKQFREFIIDKDMCWMKSKTHQNFTRGLNTIQFICCTKDITLETIILTNNKNFHPKNHTFKHSPAHK